MEKQQNLDKVTEAIRKSALAAHYAYECGGIRKQSIPRFTPKLLELSGPKKLEDLLLPHCRAQSDRHAETYRKSYFKYSFTPRGYRYALKWATMMEDLLLNLEGKNATEKSIQAVLELVTLR